MNFSNPQPFNGKLNKKKETEKSLKGKWDSFMNFLMAATIFLPDNVKEKITPQQFQKAIKVIIVLIVYTFLMGIFSTFYFLFKIIF